MPTLTFPKADLQRVQRGEKRETRRVSHILHRTKPGDPAVLQFGARNDPTTLRTTVSDVEVLDYLAYRDRLVAAKDPRGDLAPEAFDAAIGAEGTPEERRMLAVAREYGKTVTGMVEDLDDATQEAVERTAERKGLNPSQLSDADLDDLYRRHHMRVVIVRFHPPA